MQKIQTGTPDLTDKKIEEIGKLYPNVITEKEDKDGNTVKAVDFELLKQELSKEIVDDDNERYRLDWPGKKRSLLKANTPIDKTLRPVREDSVNFDTTENLYIEGDNFEALKILQESYLGKVKMIYIDPPYNTGKDFVYKDNFKKSKAEYEEELDITDEEGGKLIKNTDTNGRFHSDWLSMMYERLLIARDLLKEDGVIFISIDDNEVHNLRKIADEVFGEDNFLSQLVIHSNPRGRQSNTFFPQTHEYILVYSKSIEYAEIYGLDLTEKQKNEYSLKDENGLYREIGLRLRGGRATAEESPTLHFPLYFNEKTSSLSVKNDGNSIEIIPKFSDGTLGTWRWSKTKITADLDQLKVRKVNGSDGERYDVFQKDYLSDEKRRKAKSLWNEKEINYDRSKDDFKQIGMADIFDYSKPSYLVKKIAIISTSEEDVVIDFFSGSATTAHAVMQLNAEDGGNRKFIMVQIPEETEENSDAFKAGYKYITDIGKERIRRAAKKIQEDYKDELAKRETPLDTGFRVFKVDSTNLEDVTRHPSEVKQEQLLDLVDNIKSDRTPEDLLVEVMLNSGLELSLPIVRKEINYKTVFFVAENSLVACFDKDVDEALIDEIADIKPLKVVLRDASFKDDKDRINFENRFKSLSPDTVVSVI